MILLAGEICDQELVSWEDINDDRASAILIGRYAVDQWAASAQNGA
jgi:hypothetical protein